MVTLTANVLIEVSGFTGTLCVTNETHGTHKTVGNLSELIKLFSTLH